MSDTPTPRTDEEEFSRSKMIVNATKTESLERELAEAKSELAELRKDKLLLDAFERAILQSPISVRNLGELLCVETIEGEHFEGMSCSLRIAIDDFLKQRWTDWETIVFRGSGKEAGDGN